jgi:acyl carrier protein
VLNEAEVYDQLTEIFRDVFMRDDMTLNADLSAKDVEGWDSFRQIEIILAVEQRFDIHMTTRELDSLRSVGDLVRVIEAKQRG